MTIQPANEGKVPEWYKKLKNKQTEKGTLAKENEKTNLEFTYQTIPDQGYCWICTNLHLEFADWLFGQKITSTESSDGDGVKTTTIYSN